jgi:uncharacterized protein YqeY
MNIIEDLRKKQIQALKERNSLELSVIRFLVSALKNKEIDIKSEENRELSVEDIERVFKKQIKIRKVSIESYSKGNREDLVEKENQEKEILERLFNEYFPNS